MKDTLVLIYTSPALSSRLRDAGLEQDIEPASAAGLVLAQLLEARRG